jgi:hypothetical protein
MRTTDCSLCMRRGSLKKLHVCNSSEKKATGSREREREREMKLPFSFFLSLSVYIPHTHRLSFHKELYVHKYQLTSAKLPLNVLKLDCLRLQGGS